MFKDYEIGEVFGARVRIHGTLLALAGFFLLSTLLVSGPAAMLSTALTVLIIMTSVALHELGHIGAARYFGIGTTGLTLYPIGGVARLTREARTAMEEIVVALAGPAVNVAIASLAALALVVTKAQLLPGWLQFIIAANVVMAVFNLIPAYPMDGGRVLKGALWNFIGRRDATEWAAKGGQFFGVLFAIVALFFGQLSLFFIGLFVFFYASQERKRLQFQTPEGHWIQRMPSSSSLFGTPFQSHASPQGSAWANDSRPAQPRGRRIVIVQTPHGTVAREEFYD